MKLNIDLINVPGSVANRKFALQVQQSDLPSLTEEQKSFAKDFGIPKEEYARQVLARRYSEARYRGYAKQFGSLLMKTASPRGVESAEVIYDGWDNKFHCRLKKNGAEVPLVFDADIITVPLERGDESGLRRAEKALERAVGWAVSESLEKTRGSSKKRSK